MATRRFDWVRLGIGVVAILAVTAIVLGFALAQTGEEAEVPISDEAVERVFPQQGDLVLRQSQVGVDLAPGYRGVLIIDGVELPTTDLVAVDPSEGGRPVVAADAQFDLAQNTITFLPREGASIEDLEPGEHTATAIFWRLGETRDAGRSFTWRFTVS